MFVALPGNEGPHGAHVGIQPKFLAEAHVRRPESTANRRGQGGLQGELRTPDALECFSRQRVTELLDSRHPSLVYVPYEGRAQRIQHNMHGCDNLGPDTVTWNQSRLHAPVLIFACHAHRSYSTACRCALFCNPAQNVFQDAAVPVVGDLFQCVDAAQHWHVNLSASRPPDQGQIHARPKFLFEPEDVDHLLTGDTESPVIYSCLEGERQYAHADEVRSVDTLEAFGDDSLDAEQGGSFRGPVARGAHAIFLPADHDQRDAFRLVPHGGVIDRHLLTGRMVLRDTTLDARHHLIADADVGEGAAHHDFVVTAPRAVAIEILWLSLMLD